MTRTFRTALVALCIAGSARAEIDVRSLAAARAGMGAHAPVRTPVGVADRDVFSVIVELPQGEDPAAYGLPRLGSHFSATRAPLAELDVLARAHPDWRVRWSPPLNPLLDRALQWTRTTQFRNDTGFTGKDVVVGVIDTGVDLFHRDLRHADGTTRVAYVIDFAHDPLGVYPDAEARCTEARIRCAVYGRAEIDAALVSPDGGGLPVDTFGHGTHVASLAASSGGADGKYVGTAPESTLVIASAANGSGEVGNDATVLVAAELVFMLAEMDAGLRGLPRPAAVVNMSLGGDFGAHDGSSTIERGLSDLVGPEHPGRAIVVSAGNSAGVFAGYEDFPEPLGLHTEVHVPEGGPVRVPLVALPGDALPELNAGMFVWISTRPGDDLRVGVDRGNAEFVPVQPRGTNRTFDGDPQVTVNLVNGASRDGERDAVVIIEGRWPTTQTFSLRLEGHGTANLWVQSTGDLGPGTGSLGARFPAGLKESTVTIPATSPSLIAVGATVNRLEWTDRVGDPIAIDGIGGVRDDLLDGMAFFSSAGPTADFRMKPDLVAPGAFVAGAMSLEADPGRNRSGMFATSGLCRPVTDCTAIDPTHGVAMGTSMSAPIVAGAVALLLQGDPELTQDRILTLLQAGARHPEGTVALKSQMGAGALDLTGTLDVQRLEQTPEGRSPSDGTSWIALTQTYAHPDPEWEIPMLALLRDADGRIADGPDADDVEIDVQHGRVTGDVEKAAPGFFRFAVAAERDTGGADLAVDVYAGSDRVASATLPIAVDRGAEEGFVAHGGCAVSRGVSSRSALSLLAVALIAARGRRRSRAVRTARNQGRTDTSG